MFERDHLAQVYDASHGGLDIILSVCPQAESVVSNLKRKFRLRPDEKTPSACLYAPKDSGDCWHVVDYGGGEGERCFSPIDLYMRDRGYRQQHFSVALHELMELYGVSEQLTSSVNRPDITTREALDGETGQPRRIRYRKGFTPEELRTWGPCVKAEHLTELGWQAVASIEDTKNGKTTIKCPTPTFPIFAETCEYTDSQGNILSFRKVYEPCNPNKAFRFFCDGQKPRHYLFGLQALRRKVESLGGEKLPEVVIVSGGSDAVNLLSMGYQPVWLGSETEELTQDDMKLLSKYAHRIVNIPDIDATGLRMGRRLALRYPDIYTAWMTDEDMHHLHDKRQRRRKDLKDFIELNPSREAVRNLINRAQSALYWSVSKDKDGNKSYTVSASRLNYYLGLNGFCTLKDDTQEKPVYVRLNGHRVQHVVAKTIVNFLTEQARRQGLPRGLQDKLLRSHDVPNNNVSHLPERDDMDFGKATETSQRFFFRNGWVEVTAGDITFHNYADLTDGYVWEDSVIQHDYRRTAPMFKVEHDAEGRLRVSVNEHQPSKFFRFVMNASRLYWRKELEKGQELTPEERDEENLCLLSKLVNIGYLLFGFKSESQAWATLCLDATMGETEDECNGRSGKSFYLKALGQLLNTFCIEARVPSVVDNRFLFDGVTEATDLIIVDECHRLLNFDFFYGRITGNFRGENKGEHPFEIPFQKSPKFAFGSNYTLRRYDPSTMGRVWPQLFSDYYHERTRQNDYLETRKISDDFGQNLMGSDYAESDWQTDIHFMLECVQLFLQLPANERKVMPPMARVELRSERADIGRDFEEFANVYFSAEGGNLDREVKRDEVFSHFCCEIPYRISKNKLTTKLKAYCQYASHIHCLNPAFITGQDKDGERLVRRIDGSLTYMFYVQSVADYESRKAKLEHKEPEQQELQF